MSQNTEVLDYLRRNQKGMTQADAFRLGIFRLASRIHDLKSSGYEIEAIMEKREVTIGLTKKGTKRWARYFYIGKNKIE